MKSEKQQLKSQNIFLLRRARPARPNGSDHSGGGTVKKLKHFFTVPLRGSNKRVVLPRAETSSAVLASLFFAFRFAFYI
ncbi:MAG: hypothetical protein A3J08_01780 [Candidatus Lloydbacteria bacterium RIFCSPLOWO2_02_FULL_51_11]|uniref:Uncharacterized protein n=1 Tax=Candidatus Lloydbacteria bacterium RIFCSPLOWO2_02_FULL_51_11 TaxID=1798667 RepID=A0A1G2DN18_9BACT|nr:MAG: hypothetical protein A3J08_01780 [Candidatus Lloydbacteria bacterium RIFCSPLOWO2_02_FULL_51_11]